MTPTFRLVDISTIKIVYINNYISDINNYMQLLISAIGNVDIRINLKSDITIPLIRIANMSNFKCN